jgi:uncharacterized protein (DUF2147 family)
MQNRYSGEMFQVRRYWRRIAAGMVLALACCDLGAQASGVIGDWREPTGSVIHIGQCGAQVCLWIIVVSSQAPAATDIHNRQPNERGRALCGLRIGSGFTLRDADHAGGGTLYDPKSGKTYLGAMTAAGSVLALRGYVGIPLFGQSQTWTRITKPVKACMGADSVK